MESYTIAELSDEVFGHLCSIALDKCNDKAEKRRAGLGGLPMRKRVLLRNFVQELVRVQNDRETEICEAEIIEETLLIEDNPPVTLLSGSVLCEPNYVVGELSKSDLWLAGETNIPDSFSEYLGDSILNEDSKLTSRLYDLFVSPEENTAEGGKPEATLPTDDGFVPPHSYDSFTTYDLDAPSNFELVDLSYSPLSDVLDPLPLQPVRVEPSDKLFLSLNNYSYSEMKSFKVIDSPPMESIITDLDAGKENHFEKKRKIEDDCLVNEAKRPKL